MLNANPFIMKPHNGFFPLSLILRNGVQGGMFMTYNTKVVFIIGGLSQATMTRLRDRFVLQGGLL